MRALFRFFGLLYLLLCYIIKNLVLRKTSRYQLKKEFIQHAIHLLNIKIELFGQIPDSAIPRVLISNHRSYLDPIVILNYIDAKTVAKDSIKNWPLFGWGAYFAGVIWVDRKSTLSKFETKNTVIKNIKRGSSVLIFPEGTTHNFEKTIGFKKGIFEECAQNKVDMVPISIEYKERRDSWIGKDNFIRHFFECFSKRETKIAIFFHEPLKVHSAFYLYENSINEINEGMKWMQNYFKNVQYENPPIVSINQININLENQPI